MTQKQKYQTKTVLFSGEKLTLYSLDGCTWSSRKEELNYILERHESEKVTAAQLRGETVDGAAAQPQSPALRKPTSFGGRFMPMRPGVAKPGTESQSPPNEESKAASTKLNSATQKSKGKTQTTEVTSKDVKKTPVKKPAPKAARQSKSAAKGKGNSSKKKKAA